MRKSPDHPAPQSANSDDQQLAPIIPIRTETTLTRYPIHRLAKTTDAEIKHIERNEQGTTAWEVMHPPGPLAYKLDTLIINRIIDSLRPNIPRVIRLGSLAEIARELGLGGDTASVKKALFENVAAVIKGKIISIGAAGARRSIEFGTGRYGVILTGETLPDGRKADAVYLRLHEDYYNLLLHAQTRPLDYEYLKLLPPAAQRLYELLSFAMFGALKYGRPNAQLRYSEFCRDAPLTRYYDIKKMHTQMRSIHKPHIENDYFEKVTFEKTVDDKGQIDWLMKYKPGRRAKIEYATFTAKQKQEREPALRLAPAPKAARELAAPPPLSAEEKALVEQLTAYQITANKARQLVVEHRAAVERELQAFAFRDKSGIKDAAAWLVRAIERGDYSAPPKLAAQAKQQPTAQQTQQQTQQQAQQQAQTQADHQAEYEAYLRREMQLLETQCPPAWRVFREEFIGIYADAGIVLTEAQRPVAELAVFQAFAARNPNLGVQPLPSWLRAQTH